MSLRWILVAILLPVLALPARAKDEKPDVQKLIDDLTYEQLALKAVEFHDAGDLESFRTIARCEDDPWIMAEELLFLGRKDLAEIVAKAVPGALTAKLPAYVASAQDADERRRMRALRARMRAAFLRRDHVTMLAAVGTLRAPPRTVSGVRVWDLRATAFRLAGRHKERLASSIETRDLARDLGWLRGATRATAETASAAFTLGDWPRALQAYRSRLAFARTHGPPANVIWSLRNLGLVHKNLGDYDAAVAAFQEGLATAIRLGNESAIADLRERTAGLLAARGRHREALALYEKALKHWQGKQHALRRVHILTEAASIHQRLDADDRALDLLQQALGLLEEIPSAKWRAFRRAYVLQGLGYVHLRRRRPDKALELFTQARDIHRDAGDKLRTVETERAIADAHIHLGNPDAALAARARGLEFFRRLKMRARIADALHGTALIHKDLGEYTNALELLREAHGIYRALEEQGGIARTLVQMGQIHHARGSLESALQHYRRAHTSFAERGERGNAALALRATGHILVAMGRYAEALDQFERSLVTDREIENPAGVGNAQNGIGVFYASTGQLADALVWFRRAIATRRSVEPPAAVGGTLVNVANVLEQLGRHDEALVSLQQATEPSETAPHSSNRASALIGIGGILGARGDHAAAQARFEAARAIGEKLGDRRLTVMSEANIALAIAEQGDRKKALRRLRRALDQAEHLRLAPMVVRLIADIARLRLAEGQAEQALLTARQAGPHLELILGGLGESGASGARSRFADLYAVGTLAAARQDAARDMLYFLENGRAGALLETLRGRSAMRWTDLSPELRDAEQAARAMESRASWAYGRAVERGDLELAKARAKALDEARRGVREVSARIQRQAKREAGVFYPRAAPLEEIQETLRKDQALVAYAFCLDEVVALVLRRDREQVVRLGSADEMRKACAALAAGDRAKPFDKPLQALRARLVKPLGLGADTTEVLVSPDGPLCYLPYGLLFEHRRVALTPSGTTHALLAADVATAGRRVLALGDPAYDAGSRTADPRTRSGRRLARLPATRAEAEAVGDAILLGSEGTEPGLIAALAKQERWRAVHLACHGLVDTDRPLLSSLALSPGGGSDGLLTALEVLRMRIPADLVTLSACETAKGKIQRAEGIVGLTRAFMYAGAPRVLCSLWKVDDEATSALMVKFYDLWNPKKGKGIGAAAALRQAQSFVRGKPGSKWHHPYYWAAWVLWGLPD